MSASAQLQTFDQAGITAAMRRALIALLSLLAALCILVGVAVPVGLASQARQDRAYYKQFQRVSAYTAAFAGQHGHLPPEATIAKAIILSPPMDELYALPPKAPSICDRTFQVAPGDRLVLWFWRGEWAECFAYPSGRTTLPMTFASYLSGNLGLPLLFVWLSAFVALAAVFQLLRRRRQMVAEAAG